ncbi:MAG: ParB/RepB/Spo0J family partition protein, partial [Clostridiales bacterium]|nr:ParB/RepB/Spo0J family partition protein [Clostridiales bacterium]
SNIQREDILPSERARAYKMKMDAIKRQGARTDLTSPNGSAKFRSDDRIGERDGVSGDTVRNYISLNNLTPPLMQMVDEKKIALTPAYQLAALSEQEQELLVETMSSEQATPSLSQAQRMKKLSQNGELNEDAMLQIMMEQKKPVRNDIVLPGEKLRKYFPRSYSPEKSRRPSSSCWMPGCASASTTKVGKTEYPPNRTGSRLPGYFYVNHRRFHVHPKIYLQERRRGLQTLHGVPGQKEMSAQDLPVYHRTH